MANRTEHVMIRMTPEMKAKVTSAAENLGLTRTTYIHMAMTYYLSITKDGTIPVPKQDIELDKV